MKIRNNKLIVVALSVALIHFILTSVTGHYIAVQIGTQMGSIVAGGLIEAYGKSPQQSSQKSEEEAKRIYQNMQTKSDDVTKKWEIPMLLISLPIKQFMKPFLKDIGQESLRMVVSKEISKHPFYARGMMINYAANLVNSFALGLLIYIIIRILNRKSKHNTRLDPPGDKPGAVLH
jgi:hypothetical protein